MLTVCVTAAAYAQGPLSAADRTRNAKTAARIERYRLDSKENNLFVTAASGITAHNQATAGVKVEPVAFLVVKDGVTRVMPVALPAVGTVDRVIDLVPQVMDRVESFIDKKREKADF